MRYSFRQPQTPEEFEQIFALNYAVFVEELGQYPSTADRRLVDKFHHKNEYTVALHGARVVGMVATHSEAPFSIEQRLSGPEQLCVLPKPLLEVRLLAVAREHRNGRVFRGLIAAVFDQALDRGYRAVVISGHADHRDLYERLGFRALGPAQPYGKAHFVPMAADDPAAATRILRGVKFP